MTDEFKDIKEAIPTLTFGDPVAEPAAEPAVVEESATTPAKALEDTLTPEELAAVETFSQQIDLHNSGAIMSYGVGAQQKLADFSTQVVGDVATKDMGEVGGMITELVTQLKSFEIDPKEQKGLLGLFRKSETKLTEVRARYSKVEANVTTISQALEAHQVQLLKDVQILDRMFEMNLAYFKELTMYIIAGKKRLKEVREGELKELQAKAEASGLPEDAQAARDLAAQCDRFEKKLYDLELTRTIAMQTAPQIRMVQSSDTLMAEKIQSTLVNTIPLWKNQMVIAIGIGHATEAAKAEREVNDMTNKLLQKNADALKLATVEAAKESERGIVDMETLVHTNETLISAMDEVLAIQQEGKERRAAAETQLAQIEDQLKQKLLEAARN